MIEKEHGRRSHLEVLAVIIKCMMSDTLSTHQLIFHANLNRQLAKQYLGELRGKGLIETNLVNGVTRYSATPKGIEWLRTYVRLLR